MKRQDPPATIDDYLAALDTVKRAALAKLRRDIRAAAPGAEETISYQLPAFKLAGRLLVCFGAAAKHCAFYPGAFPVEALGDALAGYATSKGTIRFPPGQPLPAALVRKIVKLRIGQIAASGRAAARTRRRSPGAGR